MERGQEVRVVKLRAVEATPESFAPFGQVIAATPDGDEFGPHDAQLDLSRGIPRFYIMRLENRPLKFSSITHHASVTQCLGSIGGQDWYLGVAKPSIVDDGASEESGREGRKPVRSAAGHYYLPPDPAEVCVFRVSGAKFLKLNTGTWHAGPLFKADAVDFYNLELSNTNSTHIKENLETSAVLFSYTCSVSWWSGGLVVVVRFCKLEENPVTAMAEDGWPLGLGALNARAGVLGGVDGSASFSTNFTASHCASSSLLRQVSTESAWSLPRTGGSMTLASLIGLVDAMESRRRPSARVSRSGKLRALLLSLCLRSHLENGGGAPSLRQFLELERRASGAGGNRAPRGL